MKNSEKQMTLFAETIINSLKTKNLIQFKAKEYDVVKKAVAILKHEFQKEKDLEEEVNKMMDELERQNPGSFERYKMFPLLKKRLAKEKGLVL